MRIVHNGDAREVAAATLAALLHELDYDAGVVATALNGEFVPADERAATPLADGDRVEVLAPMQGG